MQGVTELVENERCDDAWLRGVQHEVRTGTLSHDSHAFLHGRPTSVPGSWVGSDVECGNARCRDLAEVSKKRISGSPEEYIATKECKKCKEDRASRALVATSEHDFRFKAEQFAQCPAIFANNDLKYEANKLRATLFAATVQEPITYCPAKDVATPEALRERPDLPAQKLSWLQRHDRECGDLYGIVTLIKGMPVALTDHIDRSLEKQLLRGKVGVVHSWILDDKEQSKFVDGVRILTKLPKLVIVKFKNSDGSEVPWQLSGMPEKGLYPIAPKKSCWFLDKGRQYPVLKIRRQQLPLAPAFAITSHAAQGQTFKGGCIVDLCIGRGSNPLGSYVALTRVTNRKNLLIYRPFQKELFSKGEEDGPEYLLKLLRGQYVDWRAIEDKYMPRRRCVSWNCVKFKECFAAGQFNREDKICFCKECVTKKEKCKTPYRCNTCGLWKKSESFKKEWLHPSSLRTRVCTTCVETRKCRGECKQWKEENAFTKNEWSHAGWPHDNRGACNKCMKYSRQKKPCSVCKKELPFDAFQSGWHWARSDAVRKCTDCTRDYGATQKICSVCKKNKPRGAYGSDDQWFADGEDRKCRLCRDEKNPHGMWKCPKCGPVKAKTTQFTKWLAPNKKRKKILTHAAMIA